MNKGKALIFSAPSGAGKTTIVRHLVETIPGLAFSISATTREKRANETEGIDYYFISVSDFRSKIDKREFLEWEQVYDGVYYGTLKSEVERIWNLGKHVIFDVDVEGGIQLKNILGERAISIFVKVNDLTTLRQRLLRRNSESDHSLEERVRKAEREMAFEPQFDRSVLNDNIQNALKEAKELVEKFLLS